MTRLCIAIVAAVVLWGCPSGAPDAPRIEKVTPKRLSPGVATRVTLEGDHFYARVQANLDVPDRSAALLPTVRFIKDGERLEGADVRVVSAKKLELLSPEALTPGTWTVQLEDGWQRTAELEDAVEVTQCASAADCDDGIPCTVDQCASGTCTAALPADSCVIDAQCVAAGSTAPGNDCRLCDPAASNTQWTQATSATPCSDGDLCTESDACEAGVCTGTPKTCATSHACEVASCDPLSGACVVAAAPDGTSCEDGYQCTSMDSCQAAVCSGTVTCPNTAPRACVLAAPVAAIVGEAVAFDARCTRDLETAPDGLSYRFDFDGDGTWDTSFSSNAQTSWSYLSQGLFPAWVEVQDPSGLSDFARVHVHVDSALEELVVTTGVDENDPGATAAAPGGAGLSLREAIQLANANPAFDRIRFSAPLTVKASNLPSLARSSIAVVGDPSVKLDFSPALANLPCLSLSGDDQLIAGLSVTGCPGNTLQVLGARLTVIDTRLEGAGGAADGIRVEAADAEIGPGVELLGFGGGAGVELRSSNAQVREVASHHNDVGIRMHPSSDMTRIERSLVYANDGEGIDVKATAEVYATTLDGNGGHGITVTATIQKLSLRSSLLTGNGKCGLNAIGSAVITRETNGYWGNAQCAVSSGAPGASDVLADPLYLNPTGGDFRLTPGSPAIDTGPDLQLDLNGPAAGTHNGTAPDLGAKESP